ncbi:MAG: succinate dehydrogenase assembly factor 2 [Gammaproteobacteria bacterium]|nr:succinate dehydrogenase assembly factor 2 [Gammaproteobacteria bacterium]MYD81144.1 succinate dehydrogenase assembly factor 2 [Gammaproteobacteria bacterium]
MHEKQQAAWRSRRGLLELDILLQPFVQNCYDSLTDAQKQSLHEMLNLDDVVLLTMLCRPPSSGKFKEVVQAILTHHQGKQSFSQSRD